MNERSRLQFTLSTEDCKTFVEVKKMLESYLGVKLTKTDVVKYSLSAMKKHIEAGFGNGR